MISVAFGGAIGAVARYIVTEWSKRRAIYPFITSIINIVGSFLFGFIVIQSTSWTAFFCAGVLGGFTTFSTFIIDVWTLLDEQQKPLAFLYVGISVFGSIFACFLGLLLGGII